MPADRYARTLLDELGEDPSRLTVAGEKTEPSLWAESGGRYLTGEPDGPGLPSPVPLATAARGAWLALAALSDRALDPQFPAHQLLGERAAILGLRRRGAVSPGGACHLLPCADGRIALNLAREDDWRLLPAWLEHDVPDLDTMKLIVATRSSGPLVARARLLGLAAAPSRVPTAGQAWYQASRLASARASAGHTPLVIDLSTIWAGPLCGALLADLGARVIKVESANRPDGARAGPGAFFDLLNSRKESVTLDLGADSGRAQLRQLLQNADIVIESARPRGLEQMGISAADLVTAGRGKTWLSITGYGRDAPRREWIAYGDDAGVAAGLSALLRQSGHGDVFCGDAIADPLTGLHAALLAWQSWRRGGGLLLDVPLTGVLARCASAGRTGDRDDPGANDQPDCPRPVARTSRGRAPAAGGDTGRVLVEFGISH
jgi:crotonobetainyl-CoA:carnitine CoA-transferase CaiB-like acyl-CoA transferase